MTDPLTLESGDYCGSVVRVDVDRAFTPNVFLATVSSFDSRIDPHRAAVIKYAEDAGADPTRGNRISVERHVYDILSKSPLAPHALGYLGSGVDSGRMFIVLERAVASLEVFYSADEDVRVAIAAVALQSTIEFLLSVNAERGREPSTEILRAHRDIKPANMFLVERKGHLIPVIGDFGFALLNGSAGENNAAGTLAPEQVRDKAPANLQTDLWGAALSAWILLHGGVTPYHEPGEGWLSESQAQPERGMHQFSLEPLTVEDKERVPDTELLKLVNDLLAAPNGAQRLKHVESARAELREIVQKIGPWRTDGDFGRRLKGLVPAPRPGYRPRRPPSFIDGLLHRAPEPRTHSGDGDRAERHRREAERRAKRWQRVRRSAAAVFGVTGAVLVAVADALRGLPLALGVMLSVVSVSTVAAFFELMPLPTAEVDHLQQWVAAAVVGGVGVILIVLAVLRRLATPTGDRLARPWIWPLVAGVLAAGTTALIARIGLAQPWSPSMIAGCAAAALAGVGVQARAGRWAGMRARRSPRRRVGRVLRPAAVLGLGLVLIVAPFATPVATALANHEVDAPLTGFVPGMTSDAPVFFAPRSLAVNREGDAAVVDSVGDHRDAVWIVPDSAQEAPFRVLLTVAPSTTPGVQGALREVPRATSADWQQSIEDWVQGEAAPVRSVTAVDFIDDDSLILVGEDGVTRLDFDRGARGTTGTMLTRLSTDPALTSAGSAASVLVVDDKAYLRTYSSASGSTSNALTYAYCLWPNVQTTPRVYTLDLASKSPALTPVTRPDGHGGSCVDATQMIYADNGSVRQIRERRRLTTEPITYEVAALDGANDAGSVIADFSPQSGIRSGATDGARLLINAGYCLTSRAFDGARLKKPVAIDPAAGSDCAGAAKERPDGKPTCDTTGRGALVTNSSYRQPLAVGGPDGDLFVAAPARQGCTAVILRLPRDENEWSPVGRVTQQSERAWDYTLGETSLMSTERPDWDSRDGVRWLSGSRAWFESGPDGTRADGFSQHLIDSPVEGQDIGWLPAGDAEPEVTSIRVGLLSTYRPDPNTRESAATTEVHVSGWIGGVRREVSIPLTGVTDIETVGGRTFFARCGQIGSFETDELKALVRQGTSSGDATVVAVAADTALAEGRIGARIWVGAPAVAAPCALPSGRAVPVDERLVRSPVPSAASGDTGPAVDPRSGEQGGSTETSLQIAPVALDVRDLGDDQYEFFFAEASVFGDAPVSRIRVAYTQTDRVVTVGFDSTDPRHMDEASTPTGKVLAGDLLQRGLIPTDVAVSGSGVIAVSTLTSHGTGPLLLIKGNRTAVVTAGDSQISGVAWSGADTVVVTDIDRGDVKVLDVTAAIDRHVPPIVAVFAWLPFSPAHGAGGS